MTQAAPSRLSKRRAFLAGFAIAVVAFIKLPYAAIPLAVAVPTLWRWFRRDARAAVVDVVWPALLGSFVILVPFFVYFGINGVYGVNWFRRGVLACKSS